MYFRPQVPNLGDKCFKLYWKQKLIAIIIKLKIILYIMNILCLEDEAFVIGFLFLIYESPSHFTQKVILC